MLHITKRDVVKFAAHCVVNATTTTATDAVLTNAFSIEDDTTADTVVEIGSRSAGVYVMYKTWDRVDHAVDSAANWRLNRKEMKKAKKSAK